MATLIGRDEVKALVAGGAQLVEVLPAAEYAEDHLPSALSHPLRRLDKEAGDLDAARPIIVYCWDAA
jgi:rhodanese-related sulfurtransferase